MPAKKKSKRTTSKKQTSLVRTNKKENNNRETTLTRGPSRRSYDVVEIQRFTDNQGTSFRNKDDVQNYRTSKNTVDKTSKYGVNPAVYYDSSVDYRKPHGKVVVVNKFDKWYLRTANRNADAKAKALTRQAIDEYNHEVARAKLVTKKNMTIAKVEALRTLTKAIVIEKNFNEKENEVLRHKETIKNIHKLREQLLEKNEIDLKFNLEKLARDNEIELKNNEDDYIRTKIKIEQKSEIIDLKIRNEKERIRTLSRGEDHRKKSLKNEIRHIKYQKHVPQSVDLDSNEDSIQRLVSRLKSIDPRHLSREERDIIAKFLRLVNAYDSNDKHNELLANYKEALMNMDKKINKIVKESSKTKKGNEFMITSYESYRKVINAKKESLLISEPAKLYEQPNVRTKVIKMKSPVKMETQSRTLVKIKPQQMHLEKIQPQKLDLSDMYYDRDIIKTINKFKRIVSNASTADDFYVSRHGKGAYKINFERMTYTKYEIRWGRKRKQPQEGQEGYDVQYKQLEDLEQKSLWERWFGPRVNEYGEPIPRHISTLRRKLEKLPDDPIVVENDGIFRQEKTDLMEAIQEVKSLEVSINWTQEQVDQTLNRVNNILDIYHKLLKEDLHYRQNIIRSEIADERLVKNIARYEETIANAYATADMRFAQREKWIKEKYLRNIENAKNQSLLNIERIHEQEEDALAKEEQQHLWNQAHSVAVNNKIANNQYKYQNALISTTVKEVLRFNKKSDDPISLADMPYKILPLPVTSNATLNINIEKNGSKLVAVCQSNERRGETYANIVNEEAPYNVQKVYVLDKFRNIKDVKTRVALLNEHANIMYDKAIKYNQNREANEIEKADRKLKEKLKIVDGIYADSAKIAETANRLEFLSRERARVTQQYMEIKNQKWKIYDKDQKYKEKINKLRAKEELELLKAQRENDRNKSQKLKLTSKKDDYDLEDIIGKRKK